MRRKEKKKERRENISLAGWADFCTLFASIQQEVYKLNWGFIYLYWGSCSFPSSSSQHQLPKTTASESVHSSSWNELVIERFYSIYLAQNNRRIPAICSRRVTILEILLLPSRGLKVDHDEWFTPKAWHNATRRQANMITCFMFIIISLLLTKYNQSIASEQITGNRSGLI